NALWGNHVSVLVGDFFYSRASQLLIEQGNTRILKVLADCTIATTEGEIWETLKSSDLDTNRDDYINIIKLKTAFLFQAACQVGGILGGVSDCFVKALSDYGLHLGMAFQLVDDILDYNASEDVFGKSQGIDLREGKLTLPLILSLGRAAPDEKQVIKNAVLADKIDQELFERVRQIIRKYHGFEDTLGLAVEHIAQAKQSLDPFRESLEKGILASLADYVINRER
ncbi:MAG: octaprenyl-diphosphate synthase, partial [uncultured bacterium]